MRVKAGRWELVRPLGRGGMGEVWLGHDPTNGEQAAIKLLAPHAGLDSRLRFAREAEALRQLRAPGIVSWIDHGELEQRPWFAMAYCPGGSLAGRVKASGPLPAREAVELARDLAAALAAAHQRGVLHRDLKPENVLLDARGRPLLCDFGLTRPIERGQSLTETGTIMGTPGYLAPEQVGGDKEHVGPATDVYGLGATLYFLLTGTAPFRQPTVLATLQAVLGDPPQPPSALRADLSHGLDALVLGCLAKSPAERPPGALALKAALDGWLVADARRGSWRARPAVLAGGLLVLALCGAGALLLRSGAPALPRPSSAAAVASPEPRPLTPRDRDEALARGQEHLRSGRYEEALQQLNHALAIDPHHAVALTARGASLAGLERREEAMLDFERALEADLLYAPAYLERAKVLATQRQGQRAQADLLRACELDPRCKEAWYLLGHLYVARRDVESGIAAYGRVLALDPDDVAGLLRRGTALAQVERHSEALADFDRAMVLAPELTAPYVSRAGALLSLGRFEEALADCDRALSLDPSNTNALVNRGMARGNLGRYDAAVEDLDRALELLPEGPGKDRVRAARADALALIRAR